jgi:hypothetical protein
MAALFHVSFIPAVSSVDARSFLAHTAVYVPAFASLCKRQPPIIQLCIISDVTPALMRVTGDTEVLLGSVATHPWLLQ